MIETNDLIYQVRKPDDSLAEFIQCFWHLENTSAEKKVATILPDGYFDIIFFSIGNQAFTPMLSGLATKPANYKIPGNSSVLAISFRLPAIDYLLNISIAGIVDKVKPLPSDFWSINTLKPSFDEFVELTTTAMRKLLTAKIDERKRQLFNLIYNTNGAIKVEELSSALFWNSRQINRYFNHRFGVSLKTYCNILRFRSSFDHLKEGRLFPEAGYFDQAHFVKEVKKFANTSPKFLAANKNDRFLQFSTLAGG